MIEILSAGPVSQPKPPAPHLKIVSAERHSDAFSIPACCDDPTPEVQPRHHSGHPLRRHVSYCANCDTDWLTVTWDRQAVEEHLSWQSGTR